MTGLSSIARCARSPSTGSPHGPLGALLVGYGAFGQNEWAAWVHKQRLTDRLPDRFADVLDRVLTFADPAISGHTTGRIWNPARRSWER